MQLALVLSVRVRPPDGFNMAVALPINVPGMDQAALHTLVETTHTVCPYSNATRDHIDVTLTVIYILRAEQTAEPYRVQPFFYVCHLCTAPITSQCRTQLTTCIGEAASRTSAAAVTEVTTRGSVRTTVLIQ